MTQPLRLDSTDKRITYDTRWQATPDSGVGRNGTYFLATSPTAQFFVLFRGTGINFYGRLGGGGGNLLFRLDGNNTNVSLNGTRFADGPTPVFRSGIMKDGDHQLLVYINSLEANGSVAVDYVEIENRSGRGFDLISSGPNAPNVPKEAITVDNSSPDIVFSDPSQWRRVDSVQYFGQALSYTNVAGASLTYTFNGVAIWYYSEIDAPHGFHTISIDGSEPEIFDGRNSGGQLAQQLLYSKTDLSPGRHTFVLKQFDVDGKFCSLDYFRILPANNTSALPSSTSTVGDVGADVGAGVTAPTSNIMPLVIGLIFGLLALLGVALGALYLQRRRRKRSVTLLEAHASPLSSRALPTQVDQPPHWPRESKRTPQRTLPPGVAMPSTTSIGGTETEQPPSYESCAETGRVGKTG